MTALTEVVRAGKARNTGFSEWPADRIVEAGGEFAVVIGASRLAVMHGKVARCGEILRR